MNLLFRTVLSSLFLLTAVNYSVADVITLTDGTKLNGTIISETANEVVMKVQVSASIVDQKTISKDEIDLIEREAKDELAWQAISDLKPGANSLPEQGYAQIIEGRLKRYLRDFPGSGHKAAVEKMVQAFEAEKARVVAGELKLEDKWLSKAEVAEQKVEIYGKQLASAMREAARRRDYVTALNAFDAMEKNYAGSISYPDAVDLARQVNAAFSSELQLKFINAQRLLAEWQQGYDVSPVDRQILLKAAQEKETAQIAATLARADEEGIRWTPVFERNVENITRLQTLTDTEGKRLALIDTAAIRAAIASTVAAQAAADAGNFEEATKLATEAKAAWLLGDAASRLLETLPAKKALAEAAAKEAEEAAKAAQAAATPVSALNAATGAAAENASATAESDEAEAKNFFLTLPGALSIFAGIVVLLGIIALVGKSGKKDSPHQE